MSIRKGKYTLLCNERMKKRPIKDLVDALNTLGSNIEYLENQGFPPLKIIGNTLIKNNNVTINAEKSSQFVSALMLIAPKFANGLNIKIKSKIASLPYILMTKKLLEKFNVNVKFSHNEIQIKHQTILAPSQIKIEADWSAAAVWFAFASLLENTNFYLKDLTKNSIQGDSKLIKIYENLNIKTSSYKNGLKIQKTNKNLPVFLELNLSETPDLMPTIAVNLCLLNIKFKLTGIENLRIKETDRINAIATCLQNFGYKIYTYDEYIEWKGELLSKKNSSPINTFDDHRIAMACSLFAVNQPITIKNPQCVEKSYPDYWTHFFKIFHQ